MKTAFYPLYCADKDGEGGGCFVWSDHAALCLGVINLWEVLRLTRQPPIPNPLPGFFSFLWNWLIPEFLCPCRQHKQAKKTMEEQGKQPTERFAWHHSPSNRRLNDERARLLDMHLQQDVGLFPALGSNLAATSGVYIRNKHLIAKPTCNLCYSCTHPYSSKKEPLAETEHCK